MWQEKAIALRGKKRKYFVILTKKNKLYSSVNFYRWFPVRSCLFLSLKLFDLTRKVIIVLNCNNRRGTLGIRDRIIYKSSAVRAYKQLLPTLLNFQWWEMMTTAASAIRWNSLQRSFQKHREEKKSMSMANKKELILLSTKIMIIIIIMKCSH